MQTKTSLRPIALLRRFQRWMARPLDQTQITSRDADVPEYLRRDVGLQPSHRKPAQRSGDPPTRDPFRLL
jgi:hypothetical protein